MYDYLLIRVNENLKPDYQIRYDSKNQRAEKALIDAWSEVKKIKNETVFFIVSANLVTTKSVTIPSKNDEIIRQSLAYTLEEELANNIEENHYAYVSLEDKSQLVSIIKKNLLEDLLANIKQTNIKTAQIFSEIFTLPPKNETLVIANINDYFLIREENSGTTLSQGLINKYLTSSKLNKATCFSEKHMSNLLIDCDVHEVNIPLLQAKTLVKSFASQQAVNLLQGEYQQNKKDTSKENPLKKLLVLGFLLVSSWLFINFYSQWQLSTQIKEIKSKQLSLFLEKFPNASTSEKNDPYLALESKLRLSQSQQNNDNSGFILALSYLGEALEDNKNVQIQSIRLRDSSFEIKLIANSLSELTNFQTTLANKASNMRIKIGARESSKNSVNAIITMERI